MFPNAHPRTLMSLLGRALAAALSSGLATACREHSKGKEVLLEQLFLGEKAELLQARGGWIYLGGGRGEGGEGIQDSQGLSFS